jgi:hypothetical protein
MARKPKRKPSLSEQAFQQIIAEYEGMNFEQILKLLHKQAVQRKHSAEAMLEALRRIDESKANAAVRKA